MQRITLTAPQWAAIRHTLPVEPDKGTDTPANKPFLEAVLTLWANGILWEDWPAELGSYTEAYERTMQWAKSGTWGKIAARIPATTEAGRLVAKVVAEFKELKNINNP